MGNIRIKELSAPNRNIVPTDIADNAEVPFYSANSALSAGKLISVGYLCSPQISIMFNKRTKIKDLLASDAANYEATVMGWVRTFRNNQFIALNDGSTNNNIQIVALGKIWNTFNELHSV